MPSEVTPACSSDTLATKQTNRNTRAHVLCFIFGFSPRSAAYYRLITVTNGADVNLSNMKFISSPFFAPYVHQKMHRDGVWPTHMLKTS